jgi:RNA polymerase sigma-70 factor, ECF subfamily
LSEKELLERIKKDPAEFSVLFREYYSHIFGYIFRRVTDFDETRDIVSETFRKAFLNIMYFDYRGISLKVWLYRIATNEAHLYFRNKKKKEQYFHQLGSPDQQIYNRYIEEDRANLTRELSSHEKFVKASQELRKLSLKYQEVIALRFFEEKQIQEIAEILDKKEGTIKSLLSRGLAILREKCNDL